MTDLCYHFIVFTSKFKFSFANFTIPQTFIYHVYHGDGFGRCCQIIDYNHTVPYAALFQCASNLGVK